MLIPLEKFAVIVSPGTGLAPNPAEYDVPLNSTTDAGFRIGTGTGVATSPVGVNSAFPFGFPVGAADAEFVQRERCRVALAGIRGAGLLGQQALLRRPRKHPNTYGG